MVGHTDNPASPLDTAPTLGIGKLELESLNDSIFVHVWSRLVSLVRMRDCNPALSIHSTTIKLIKIITKNNYLIECKNTINLLDFSFSTAISFPTPSIHIHLATFKYLE